MPKPEAEQQMKLAADVMDRDREVLRALAGRTEDMLAISIEKNKGSLPAAAPRSG
jgi:hypothetical protein